MSSAIKLKLGDIIHCEWNITAWPFTNFILVIWNPQLLYICSIRKLEFYPPLTTYVKGYYREPLCNPGVVGITPMTTIVNEHLWAAAPTIHYIFWTNVFCTLCCILYIVDQLYTYILQSVSCAIFFIPRNATPSMMCCTLHSSELSQLCCTFF